mmetsp:Transcript_9480/g.23483  ORF Transcript_9480/g.23483 Transcript_9480/m.23483 type:complete len:300 (-) Transcript_9480:46-945(-)
MAVRLVVVRGVHGVVVPRLLAALLLAARLRARPRLEPRQRGLALAAILLAGTPLLVRGRQAAAVGTVVVVVVVAALILAKLHVKLHRARKHRVARHQGRLAHGARARHGTIRASASAGRTLILLTLAAALVCANSTTAGHTRHRCRPGRAATARLACSARLVAHKLEATRVAQRLGASRPTPPLWCGCGAAGMARLGAVADAWQAIELHGLASSILQVHVNPPGSCCHVPHPILLRLYAGGAGGSHQVMTPRPNSRPVRSVAPIVHVIGCGGHQRHLCLTQHELANNMTFLHDWAARFL